MRIDVGRDGSETINLTLSDKRDMKRTYNLLSVMARNGVADAEPAKTALAKMAEWWEEDV